MVRLRLPRARKLGIRRLRRPGGRRHSNGCCAIEPLSAQQAGSTTHSIGAPVIQAKNSIIAMMNKKQ